MIYDLTQVLKDYEDKEITQNKGKGEEVFTYKDVLTSALNTVDPSTSPDTKAKYFFLTLKAYKTPEAVEYTADEVAVILDAIKRNFPPITIGRSMEFFNQSQQN